MATVTENVQAAEESAKPKWTLSVEFKSQDGSWKTASSEREFSVPEYETEVSVNIVDDNGNQETIKRKFRRILVSTKEELLQLLSENEYFVMAAFLYGADLLARNTVKGPIAAEVEGPGKMIKSQAEKLVANRAKLGKPISLERAIELVKATMDA